MTGTLINTATVVIGAGLGTFLGDRLPDRIRKTVMYGIGLTTLVLGMQMALTTGSILVVLASIMAGGILGEWWRIEDKLNSLGRILESKAAWFPAITRGDFTKGFVTASLVFCVGPMTFLGSIQDGLTGNFKLLAIKSMLDCFAGFAFAASMGFGVAFSAITVLLFQGSITLGASFFQNILTDPMIVEMTATGGVVIVGIGILLLDIKKIKVANFLPAIFIAPFMELLRKTLLG